MQNSDSSDTTLELRNICKSFQSVNALKNVNLQVKGGEVHALVGENGAGKSTLIKIIMGVYQKDSGEILLNGKPVDIKNTIRARSLGLGAVYQDVNLAQHMSVAENFYMGQMPKTKFGTVSYKTMNDSTRKILESIGVRIDPKLLVRKLSVAEQEMVCIGKLIYQKSRIVIFDEPTALLTTNEIKQLFRVISYLKKNGVGIIYISHRLDEIFEIADRVTVLKDGVAVRTLAIGDTNENDLVALMVGRKVEDIYAIDHATPGDVSLKVKDLTNRGKFSNINFEVRRGQIFGMFGLVGSGRTEIVRAIFGADAYDSGEVYLNGKRVRFTSPKQAIDHHIGVVPENRRMEGLSMLMSVDDNINMAAIKKISRFTWINHKKARRVSEMYVRDLRIKTPSVDQKTMFLSGGNQQKVVISKWFAADSDILIFDEPTVGVDIGAKSEIYKLIENLVAKNKSVIIISSYLPEIMGLADEMLVMYEGKQMGILSRKDFNDEKILKLASGIN